MGLGHGLFGAMHTVQNEFAKEGKSDLFKAGNFAGFVVGGQID